MSAKLWSKIIVYTLYLSLFVSSLVLYITDQYTIRDTSVTTYYCVPNQRYLLVEYVLKHKEKNYDAFIFGSSRILGINPLKIEGYKAYNMSYGEGIPHEHLIIIKLFLKNNIKIKHLLIGLDEFSYQVSFESHQNKYIPKSHYLATNDTMLNFYNFYFLRMISKKDIDFFKKKYIKKEILPISELMYKPIYKQTEFYKNAKDKDSHPDENDPIFKKPTIYNGNCLEDTMSDIKEIIEIAKQNNIKLTFFINPIHHLTYKYTNKELLKKFKKRLAKLTPYYDFSIQGYISLHNRYWHDTSHVTSDVEKMIMDTIYNHKKFNDFGKYIKKEESN